MLTKPRYWSGVVAAFDAIDWSGDDAAFGAWQAGRTGYPVIDAAMRQLATTGWIATSARCFALPVTGWDKWLKLVSATRHSDGSSSTGTSPSTDSFSRSLG